MIFVSRTLYSLALPLLDAFLRALDRARVMAAILDGLNVDSGTVWEVIVLNSKERKEPEKELVEHLIAILTSFAGKLYGLRSKKSRALQGNSSKS